MTIAHPSWELEAAYREQRPPRLGNASVGGWGSAINFQASSILWSMLYAIFAMRILLCPTLEICVEFSTESPDPTRHRPDSKRTPARTCR
jgi:hypothetical protein